MRNFLVYCSVGKEGIVGKWLTGDREYDIALNYWSTPQNYGEEYHFETPGQKWYGVAVNLPHMRAFDYKAIAIIDDDLEFTTDQLNQLFNYGILHSFNLWQPALIKDSYISHQIVLQVNNSGHRQTTFVEIMTPFFSFKGLCKLYWTFGMSETGWGLDTYLWPLILKKEGMAIVDELPVKHMRPLNSPGSKNQYNVDAPTENLMIKVYTIMMGMHE